MAKKASRKFFYIGVLLIAGIFVGLGITIYQLHRDLNETTAELRKSKQLNRALKKKYAEEKTKASAFQKAKLMADARTRELEDQVAAFEDRLEQIKTEMEGRQNDLQAELDGCRADVADQKKEIGGLLDRNKTLAETKKKLTGDLRQKETELTRKQAHVEELQSQLKYAQSTITRITGQNKRLSELSQELLLAFDDKGFFRSVMEKEPFTQVKRVELEKMIQEYLDKIEKETVLEEN